MRYLFALLSGMAVTLCVFVGGVAFALAYLTADPVPVERPLAASAPALTTEPATVEARPREQESERAEHLRPAPLPKLDAIEPALHIEMFEPERDELTTASLPDPVEMDPEPVEPPSVIHDHVAWCSDRYRSYRPESNSYTSYGGDIRECISPYSDGLGEGSEIMYLAASADGASMNYIIQERMTSGLSDEHIASCFSRYRSYRPEDNTYQPYGGGPREQCQ